MEDKKADNSNDKIIENIIELLKGKSIEEAKDILFRCKMKIQETTLLSD